MAARPETLDLNPAAVAMQLATRMEALAASAQWDKVEQLTVRIRNTLLEIPDRERRAAVLEVTQSFERVQTLALASRHDVTDKLSEIRRGRAATAAYDQSGR